ncbi:MAG TPA: IS66 family insertion sequence element accessory protein TnpB [Polyangiaceae bacterium]|nr:IS66 family insertion sequence element accessory protein TnpB [Polyangiaceae bacterium]
MLQALLPNWITKVVVALEPISMRLGPDKLAARCREVLRVEPDENTGFIFANRQRDTLLMYFRAPGGDEVTMKRLEKGAFVLPAPTESGTPYVIMRPAMLPRLFRA